jgi:hypothetical protein
MTRTSAAPHAHSLLDHRSDSVFAVVDPEPEY